MMEVDTAARQTPTEATPAGLWERTQSPKATPGLPAASAAAARALAGTSSPQADIVLGLDVQSREAAALRTLITSGSRAAATIATTSTDGARMPQDRRGIGRTTAGLTEGNIQQPVAFVSASHLPLKDTISSFSDLPLSAAQTFVQSLNAALTLGDASAFDNLWTELQAKRDTEPTFCERVEVCVNFYNHRSCFGVVASCAIAAEHCPVAWEAIGGSFCHPSHMLKGVLDALLCEPKWNIELRWTKRAASSTATPEALCCLAVHHESERVYRTSTRIRDRNGRPAAAPYWQTMLPQQTDSGNKRPRKVCRDLSPVPAMPSIGLVLQHRIDQATADEHATTFGDGGNRNTRRRRLTQSHSPPTVAVAPETRGDMSQ